MRSERKDFEQPSDSMFICERHFEQSCYPQKYKILKDEGKGDEIKRKVLLPDAVPTIHMKPIDVEQNRDAEAEAGPSRPSPTLTSPRSAYRKRECHRVSNYVHEL